MKPMQRQDINKVEIAGYAFVLLGVAVGIVLSLANPEFFEDRYIIEDGVIEWLTVLGFLIGGGVCIHRAIQLRRVRTLRFIALTTLLGLAFVFIAGEEVSWGQRILKIETPQWLETHNAQKEMNLHNLKVGGVKINKLLFSQLAAAVMVIYFAVLMPFYGSKPRLAGLIDSLAIPIPKLHHALACGVMLVLTQVVVASSRRGELAEFGGAFLFTLIVAFPSNFAAFDPRRSLSATTEAGTTPSPPSSR